MFLFSQSPALHQLVSLYVCRAKVIWRQNNILNWLERNVNTVIDRVDLKDDIVAEYNQKRAARYVNPPRPILRHVILSDYKEKVPLAPFVAKEKEPIVMYDPLPPLDSVNCYERYNHFCAISMLQGNIRYQGKIFYFCRELST